ncbi:MAG: hypothetical protein V4486_03605 [Patescibacteria group bacterium]
MTNKNIIPYIAVVVLGLIIFVFFSFNKKPEPVVPVASTPQAAVNTPVDNFKEVATNVPPIQFFTATKYPKLSGDMCFADFALSTANDGTYHLDQTTMLHLNIKNNEVTGESSTSVAQGWITKYEGTATAVDLNTMSRVLHLTASSLTEVTMTLTPTKLDINIPSQLLTATIKPVVCRELYEWQGVEQYLLKNNIAHDYMFIHDYQKNLGQMATPNITYSEPNPNKRTKQDLEDFFYTMDDAYNVLTFKITTK